MMHTISRATVIAAACGLAATAQGQNEWTDPAGGSYSDAANWSAGVPGPSDDLLFGVDAVYTVTLGGLTVANSITVGDSDVTIDLASSTLALQSATPLMLPSPLLGTGSNTGRLTFANGDVLFGTANLVTIAGTPFRSEPDLSAVNAALSFTADVDLHGSWVDLAGVDAGLTAEAVTLLGDARLSLSSGATAEVASLESDTFSTPQGSHQISLNGAGTRLDVLGRLAVDGDSSASGASSIVVTNGAHLAADSLRIRELGDVGFAGVVVFEASGAGTRVEIAGRADLGSNQLSPTPRPLIDDGALFTADEIRTGGDGLVIRGAATRVEAATAIETGGRLDIEGGATIVAPTIWISRLGGDSDAGLGGHGTVQGDVVVGNAASFGTFVSPGAGGLTITGGFERSAVDGGGLKPVVQFTLDALEASGFLTIGGTADLTGFDLIVSGTPDPSLIGQTFTLVDAGTLVGVFDSTSLPELGGVRADLAWSLAYTPNTVELTLIPAPGGLTLALPLGLAAVRRRR